MTAFVAWRYFTGSQDIRPLGAIALGTVVLLLLSRLRISDPRLLIGVGVLMGVVVGEVVGLAEIDGAPGSMAVFVYGLVGLIVGVAVGLAFACLGASLRHS